MTSKLLSALRSAGVRISVDDFGTGYSSLAYLKRLPVDEVKIDRSFVSDLDADGANTSLVAAVVAIAASLGISTVAEGVEKPEQAARLHELGCNEAQGYWFSQAGPGRRDRGGDGAPRSGVRAPAAHRPRPGLTVEAGVSRSAGAGRRVPEVAAGQARRPTTGSTPQPRAPALEQDLVHPGVGDGQALVVVARGRTRRGGSTGSRGSSWARRRRRSRTADRCPAGSGRARRGRGSPAPSGRRGDAPAG